MARCRLTLGLLLAASFACLPADAQARGCVNAQVEPTAANAAKVRQAVLCLHNADRARHGLGRLREHGQLRRAAQQHSAEMARRRFFAHVSPDGRTMVQRVRGTGYLRGGPRWSLGENIAWGTGHRATAAEIHRAWMRSPGHRHNILRRGFREIGIGIVPGAPVAVPGGVAATYTADFGARG